jgi:hypothetical protein
VREGGAAPVDQPGVVRIEPSIAGGACRSQPQAAPTPCHGDHRAAWTYNGVVGATLWLASGRYTVTATAPDTSAQEIP